MYSIDIKRKTEFMADGYVCDGVDVNNPLLNKAIFTFEMSQRFEGNYIVYFFHNNQYVFEYVTNSTVMENALTEITRWLNYEYFN